MIGRGAFFLAAVVSASAVDAGVAARSDAARPDVAPLLVPDDWLGRPASALPVHEWQKRKSPTTAMVASLVLPGLGQLYNEREFWALVAMGIETYLIRTIIVEQRETNRLRAAVNATPDDPYLRALFVIHRDDRIQATWLLGLAMLLSGVQSFVDAHLYDFDDTPLPLQIGPMPNGGAAAGLRLRF